MMPAKTRRIFKSRRSRYPRTRSATGMKLPQLLLVDDDVSILEISARLLGSRWQVQTAKSAEEAEDILQSRCFDVVLTDYNMTGQNGIWLLGRAARRYPRMRRVLYSGCRPGDLCLHLESGLIHSFVSKPASRDSLIASLEPRH